MAGLNRSHLTHLRGASRLACRVSTLRPMKHRLTAPKPRPFKKRLPAAARRPAWKAKTGWRLIPETWPARSASTPAAKTWWWST